jgi:hypothetical protein
MPLILSVPCKLYMLSVVMLNVVMLSVMVPDLDLDTVSKCGTSFEQLVCVMNKMKRHETNSNSKFRFFFKMEIRNMNKFEIEMKNDMLLIAVAYSTFN